MRKIRKWYWFILIQDNVLEEIIQGDLEVRKNMEAANRKIDTTREQIAKGNKKAGNLLTRVEKADKDLAEILKTYQRPSQFCLNIVLVLLLLGLMVVIINLIQGQTVWFKATYTLCSFSFGSLNYTYFVALNGKLHSPYSSWLKCGIERVLWRGIKMSLQTLACHVPNFWMYIMSEQKYPFNRSNQLYHLRIWALSKLLHEKVFEMGKISQNFIYWAHGWNEAKTFRRTSEYRWEVLWRKRGRRQWTFIKISGATSLRTQQIKDDWPSNQSRVIFTNTCKYFGEIVLKGV